MYRLRLVKIAEEILEDWAGPSGQCWCPELNKNVDPEKNCKECVLCTECQSIDELWDHPPKYVRPRDITW